MAKFYIVNVCSNLLLISLALTLKINAIQGEGANFPMAYYDSVYVPGPKDSIFISPAGLKASLALTALSAVGSTKREILNVINSTEDSLSSDILLPGELEALKQERLLYQSENFLSDFFEKKISRGITIKQVAFGTPSTLKAINNQVKKFTHGTVRNIFPNSLSREIGLAYTNALYLNAQYKTPFTSTMVRSFKKPMVHQYGDFAFANLTDLNAAALVLEFQENDAKLLVLQPNDNDLERLSDQLLNVSLTEIPRQLESTYMSLYFPIINEIKMSISVVEALQNLGLDKVFAKKGNLCEFIQNEGDARAYLKEVRQHTSFESGRLSARFAAVTGLQFDMVQNYDMKNDKCVCGRNHYSTEFADPSETDEDVEFITMKKDAPHYYFEHKLFLALIHNDDVLFVGTVAKEQ